MKLAFEEFASVLWVLTYEAFIALMVTLIIVQSRFKANCEAY